MENIIRIMQIVIAPLSTLLGACLGAFLVYNYSVKQLQIKNKLDFISRQVNELYSPLIGIIKALRANGALRLKISKISDAEWRNLVEGMSPTTFQSSLVVEEYREGSKSIIEYSNRQLKEYIIPSYNKMLDIFQKNIWLAEPDTCKWYEKFCQFVSIWGICLNTSLNPEVLEKIVFSEEELIPFYKELEDRLNILCEKLKIGIP